MAAGFSRLLRWYPPAWRERYGDDLVAYMQDTFGDDRLPARARLSLVTGGIGERIRSSGIGGDSAPPAERLRAGALVILCSWTAFVIAGANFAKLSEHFDQALPPGSAAHQLPDLAYATIEIAAMVAGIAVVAGAGVALPGLAGFLRSGGWPTVKRWVLSAFTSTVAVAALFVPLHAWAHHLSGSQRNGGSAGYTALFLTWAAIAAITLILWTGAAVAAGRRVVMPRSVLRAEAALGAAAASGMVVILAATSLWWALLAERAPLFLNADPSTPANARLIATAAIMAVSVAAAAAGTIRAAHAWRRLRDLEEASPMA